MIERWHLRLALASVAHPYRALVLPLLLVVAAAPGLLRLELRTDGHALVPTRAPEVLFDAEVRRHFDLRDPILVVIETSHPEGVYNLETMTGVQQLSDALAALPEVGPRRVMSLATEKRDRVYPGTLHFRPFLDPLPDTRERMRILRDDVAAADILEGTLVSADATAVAIHVGAPPSRRPGEAGAGRVDLYRRIVELGRRFESDTDRILVVGAPVAEALLGTHILEDLTLLVPLALAIMALVLWTGCRRAWGVALALGEVGACQVFTFGVMGWLGVPVYLTTAVLPVILTTVGLADEIHLFWHHQRVLERVSPESLPAEAVETTLREMVRPVLLTSVTTSLAFLSFLASPIAAVEAFGIFAAVGIVFCLGWSLTVIPAALLLLGPQRLRRPGARPGGLAQARLAAWLAPAFARRRTTLVVLAALTLLLGAGAGRLFIQDSWIDGFAPGSPFRRATERVNELFHGTHVLQVHLEIDLPPEQVLRGGQRSGPLLSAEVLRAIGDFEDRLRARPQTGGVLGPASHLRTVAYLWLQRREQNRRIPDEPRRIDLLLDRFDKGRGVHRRREVIDDDLRRTLVTVFLRHANYRDTAALLEWVRADAREHLEPLGARVAFAGDVAVSQAMIPAIVHTQVSSLLLALAGVLVVVSSLLRSLRAGLLAVAPVAAAVAWTFGGMGWTGVPLGVATSMFCAVTLGIGVDYSIHFLASLQRRRQAGDRQPALAAVGEAGPAIVADAAAVALGFGLLAVSQVPANARLGVLVAVALISAAGLTLAGLGALLHRPEVPAGGVVPSSRCPG